MVSYCRSLHVLACRTSSPAGCPRPANSKHQQHCGTGPLNLLIHQAMPPKPNTAQQAYCGKQVEAHPPLPHPPLPPEHARTARSARPTPEQSKQTPGERALNLPSHTAEL